MIIKPTSLLRDQYELVMDAYKGSGGFVTGDNLFSFGRELDFPKRQKMAEYTNLMKGIVDARVMPVFSEEPTRVYENNELIETFINDCDNNNTSLSEYVKKATLETVLLGNSFIIMDNFNENEIPENYIDVVSSRKFPYIYSKSVNDVFSYEVNVFGKLQQITFYYGLYNGDSNIYLYKRFTQDDIVYFTRQKNDKDDWEETVISAVTHSVGRVPVIYNNKDILDIPPYYSMASLARRIYNIDSELNDLSRSQMFSILLIPSTYGGNESKDNIVVGTSNAIFFDAQATNIPSFIAPDSDIMKVQIENRQTVLDTLLKSADVLGSTSGNTGSKSGLAYSYEFFGKMQSLKDSGSIADYYDSSILELFGLFIGVDIEYDVEYPNNFSPTYSETNEKIDTLIKVADLNISDTVVSLMHEAIIGIMGNQIGWSDDVLQSATDSIVEGSQVVVTDEV